MPEGAGDLPSGRTSDRCGWESLDRFALFLDRLAESVVIAILEGPLPVPVTLPELLECVGDTIAVGWLVRHDADGITRRGYVENRTVPAQHGRPDVGCTPRRL